jgi:phosphoglycolate phosphatase-like HAD superfamily hydrolase
MNSQIIDAMHLTEVGGVRYANPLQDEKYRVRYHDLPPADDLRAYLQLLESFERRFLHTVSGGAEWTSAGKNPDAVVQEKKVQFAAAEGGQKELLGSALCVALYERGLQRAKKHILRRMEGTAADAPEMKALCEQVQNDLMEAGDLFHYVRRKRGHPDVDDVLNEMKGEPYKIFIGTLPGASGTLEHFHLNRLMKAAMAMRCMDKVAEPAIQLAKSNPRFVEAGVVELLQELNEAAKLRVQLPVHDPEFKAAQTRLVVATHRLHDFMLPPPKPVPGLLPMDHRPREASIYTAVGLLKEAGDLIYDMAMIRGKRSKSADFFVERVNEQLPAPMRAMRL